MLHLNGSGMICGGHSLDIFILGISLPSATNGTIVQIWPDSSI